MQACVVEVGVDACVADVAKACVPDVVEEVDSCVPDVVEEVDACVPDVVTEVEACKVEAVEACIADVSRPVFRISKYHGDIIFAV